MDHPLVSVIILTYNNVRYLKQSVDSVLIQDYPNIELIISDDGSDCFPKADVEAYLSENRQSNISAYTVNQNLENLGIVKNTNKTVKISHGTYLVPLDCDDCFNDAHVLSALVTEFQKTGANIITGYMDNYDSHLSKWIGRSPDKRQLKAFANRNKFFEELCKRNFIAGAVTSYSRKLFERYGYYDERYTYLDDYPRFLHLARHGEPFHFINRTIIKYRLGGISTGHVKNPLFEEDVTLVLKKEILPYKDQLSTHVYREKRFDYRRRTEKKSHLFLLSIMYVDVVVSKIMSRVKASLKKVIKSRFYFFRR